MSLYHQTGFQKPRSLATAWDSGTAITQGTPANPFFDDPVTANADDSAIGHQDPKQPLYIPTTDEGAIVPSHRRDVVCIIVEMTFFFFFLFPAGTSGASTHAAEPWGKHNAGEGQAGGGVAQAFTSVMINPATRVVIHPLGTHPWDPSIYPSIPLVASLRP